MFQALNSLKEYWNQWKSVRRAAVQAIRKMRMIFFTIKQKSGKVVAELETYLGINSREITFWTHFLL